MADLTFVAIDDLIEEIGKRLNNLVLVGEKTIDEDKTELVKVVNGDPIRCLGLIEVIKPSVMPDILDTNYEG